jgi:hypothetical protein
VEEFEAFVLLVFGEASQETLEPNSLSTKQQAL